MSAKKLVSFGMHRMHICMSSLRVRKALYLSLFLFTPFLALAQAHFVAPTSPEYIYPPASPAGPVDETVHTSCYSLSSMTFLTTTGNDLLVHAWDGNPAKYCGIAWRRLATGSLTTVYDEGSLLYPIGTRDISVALVSDNGWDGSGGPWEIVVSYYIPSKVVWQGSTLVPGHYYDRWKWNSVGISFITTVQLSTQATYTRISMDAHNTYGIAITWEEPTGIYAIAGSAWDPYTATPTTLTFGSIVQLSGTAGFTHPDVAFGHPKPTDTSQTLHFVYYKPGGNTTVIYETRTPWPFLLTGITSFTPTTEDANTVTLSGATDLKTHIDCPDHGTDTNWSYVYTTDQANIQVRIKAPLYSPTAFTRVVNNGSLGNLPTNGVTNDWPTIAFDANQNPGSESMYIGWFTLYNNTLSSPFFGPPKGAYIAVQLKENGGLLNPVTPTNDYMTVCDTPSVTSPTPNICFSRQNDLTQYLFNIYSEEATNGYYIKNRYSKWSIGSFRLANAGAGANSYQTTGIKNTVSVADVAIYPNPAASTITVDVNNAAIGPLTINIHNMMGQRMTSTQTTGQRSVIDVNQLVPGNYVVTVQDNDGTVICKKEIVKM